MKRQPFPERSNNKTYPRTQKYPQARTTLPHEAHYSFDPKHVTNESCPTTRSTPSYNKSKGTKVSPNQDYFAA
jgi:hypothetical protein